MNTDIKKVKQDNDEQLNEEHATEKTIGASHKMSREAKKVNPKVYEIKKFKCDKCECTFKKDITLRKHQNARHGQFQNNFGEGQFGFIFGIRPGIEE